MQAGLAAALEAIAQLGPAGPLLFIGLYILATLLWIPATLLTLAAGLIYGLLWGTVWVWIGATLGACAAFALARGLLRQHLLQRFASDERLQRLDAAVGESGWRLVLLTRLSPLFPFVLLNYLFGLTAVRWRDYLLGFLGMLPGTVLYVYLGDLAGQAGRAIAGLNETPTPSWLWAVRGVGLAITLTTSFYAARLARRSLTL
jgi:uncharacterized membrane protein YdjX (TVP38/TMEM64 family)